LCTIVFVCVGEGGGGGGLLHSTTSLFCCVRSLILRLQRATQLRQIDAHRDDRSGIRTVLPSWLSAVTQGVGLLPPASSAEDIDLSFVDESDAASAAVTSPLRAAPKPDAETAVGSGPLPSLPMMRSLSLGGTAAAPHQPAPILSEPLLGGPNASPVSLPEQDQLGKAPRTRGVGVIGLDGQALNMYVLLVDDVFVVRRQAQAWLTQLGCTSRCV
jgi:hypothetical protein